MSEKVFLKKKKMPDLNPSCTSAHPDETYANYRIPVVAKIIKITTMLLQKK